MRPLIVTLLLGFALMFATTATFTVNSSVVLITTSATISASYNGTTRTATLSVLL
jgi:hypothetical protein